MRLIVTVPFADKDKFSKVYSVGEILDFDEERAAKALLAKVCAAAPLDNEEKPTVEEKTQTADPVETTETPKEKTPEVEETTPKAEDVAEDMTPTTYEAKGGEETAEESVADATTDTDTSNMMEEEVKTEAEVAPKRGRKPKGE